jgi:flagellar hook-basal body complex protein FliE
MTVEPLVPDTPVERHATPANGSGFLAALDAVGAIFANADAAESAFVAGRGGLQEMVVARAHADVAVAIAPAASARIAQALGQIFSIQL